MPARKEHKKDVMPSPDTLHDEKHDYYLGGWSCYQSATNICDITRAILSARTGGGTTTTPAGRTTVHVLPFRPPAASIHEDIHSDTSEHASNSIHNASSSSSSSPSENRSVECEIVVTDQMFIEGVKREVACSAAEHTHYSISKLRANEDAISSALDAAAAPAHTQIHSAAATTSGQAERSNDGAASSTEGTESGSNTTCPTTNTTSLYRCDDHDAAWRHMSTPHGAPISAYDVMFSSGPINVVGAVPRIKVDPILPASPAPSDSALSTLAVDAKERSTRSKSSSRSADRQRSKTKVTPEEAAEKERKYAEAMAQWEEECDKARQDATTREEYMMTFAHPNRWPSVTFANLTWIGPVQVRQAHATFKDCRFISALHDSLDQQRDSSCGGTNTNCNNNYNVTSASYYEDSNDNSSTAVSDVDTWAAKPQLTVSQYCHVVCESCTFEEPFYCAVYGQPTAEVELRRCLFSGVPQRRLMQWRAEKDGTKWMSEIDARLAVTGCDTTVYDDMAPAERKARFTVETQRPRSMGVYADAVAQMSVCECRFDALGSAVVLACAGKSILPKRTNRIDNDGASGKSDRHKAESLSPRQRHAHSRLSVTDSQVSHMFGSGIVITKSARDVLVYRCTFSSCAYYALDCCDGVRSTSICENTFLPDAVARIQEGAHVRFLKNDVHSIPIDQNMYENPCLAPYY